MEDSEDFLRDEQGDNGCYAVDLLEDNILYVHIFSHCQPDMIGGFSSFIWRNIAASEVLAACQLMQVEQDRWPDVLENVIFLGGAVANCLNAKAKR